jgi:hypothetical protein
MLFKSSVESKTPPLTGRAPPLKPVPAPLGVMGIALLLQYSKTLLISSTLLGLRTISGSNERSSV